MFNEWSGGAAEDRAATQVSAARSRPVAFVELITTAALALSTAVAITAVSIGMARADVAGAVAGGAAAPVTFALVTALLMFAIGAVTALGRLSARRLR